MGQTAKDAGALYDGVPPWLTHSVWGFIKGRLQYQIGGGVVGYRVGLVNAYDLYVRSPYPTAELLASQGIRVLQGSWDDTEVLAFIDFLLANQPDDGWDEIATSDGLERALVAGGSTWKVGTRDGFPGLERRVPKGAQEAADNAMATRGHAGARLSEAWHAVYGISPNPAHAYAMAVKAVEDASIPATVPNQANATLGHVIGRLRNDGDWSLPLTREDSDAPTAELVIRMCKALWKGHHDRHGGVPDAPQSVSQEEAEAAVHIAVFLVQGFASGLIARR